MPRQVTIVAFGDSTTAPRPGVRVYAEVLPELLAARGIAARVVNAGVAGDTTERARARCERDVLEARPQVAVVQFGINDSAMDVWKNPPATRPRVPQARFRENLEFFVAQLKGHGVSPVLMTPNPLRWTDRLRGMYGKPLYRPGDPDGFNVLLAKYADGVRAIAAVHAVELVDVFAPFQGGPDPDAILLDGMHPNSAGHRLIAGMLAGHVAANGSGGARRLPDRGGCRRETLLEAPEDFLPVAGWNAAMARG